MSLKAQAVIFLKKALGEEGFEELAKTQLFKKKTNTVLDTEEVRTALQIVPRTVLSFLQKELSQLNENEGKEIKIPMEEDAYLSITKFANDVYSGEIRKKSDIVSSFRHRSLPGVGLVIMSAFELYDITDLGRIGKPSFSPDVQEVQKIIDERLRMRDAVAKIVDERMSQKKEIEEMVRTSLAEMSAETDKKKEEKVSKEPLKLKKFLETRKNKTADYEVRIEKSEMVICPDCGNKIFDNGGFSGCVCFGPDRNKKIHIRKSEDGIKLSFSKQWDPENIEMLLEVLREVSNRSKK